MNQRTFTDAEARLLRSNPFTLKVTNSHISFTREFKELFLKEYNNGLTSRQIIIKYGYDPDLLGTKRISSLHVQFCKSLQREPEIQKDKKQTLNVNGEEKTADTIRKMLERIEYLEQEIEFLKKISSTRTSRK